MPLLRTGMPCWVCLHSHGHPTECAEKNPLPLGVLILVHGPILAQPDMVPPNDLSGGGSPQEVATQVELLEELIACKLSANQSCFFLGGFQPRPQR